MQKGKKKPQPLHPLERGKIWRKREWVQKQPLPQPSSPFKLVSTAEETQIGEVKSLSKVTKKWWDQDSSSFTSR